MFNKKINLLFITLVFMLSISAVAAFDSTNMTDDIETSDADEEPPSGSTLVVSDIKSASLNDYSLETKDLSMYYKNGTKYEVTLTQGNNPVDNASLVININGVNYTRITDCDGKAFLSINLCPGNYSISTFYNDDLSLSSNVNVLSTLYADDIVKTYRNDTQYYITCLDNNGNPLVDSDVTFNINGVFYNRKTNEDGVARLNINLNPNTYILTAIHQNGLMYSNIITVLPSVTGSDVNKFYRNGTQYHAKFLDSAANPLVNTDVSFNINGVFYTRTTDENGIATLNINLMPGSYILTATNPINGELTSNLINVLPTLITSDIVSDTREVSYGIILINNDGSVGSNKNMAIYVDGICYDVKTNDYGIGSIDLNLSGGIHNVVSVDTSTGLEIHNIINITVVEIVEENETVETLYYSIYGVSPDNKTIMAIGRPSASGEVSKYGYKFYMTVFERVCPHCGSTELYWGIFWTGDETSNYGVFPATGYKEGGSAEGHIFCANCDADWSVFGNEHVSSGKSLKVVSQSTLSSKSAAYMLKNGEMIYS